MYLDWVLGSRTKVNSLAVLVESAGKGLLEVELAKEAGTSVSEVNRQMRDLASSGLIHVERLGRGKVYTINKRHFLYKPLRNLFRNLSVTYRRLASELVRHVTANFRIEAAILFGSLSRGAIRSDIMRTPSDVDLAIIARSKDVPPVKKALISYVASEVSDKYGISVYPVVLSVEEYLSRLKHDPFIIDLHAKGEVLYGQKPRRFG